MLDLKSAPIDWAAYRFRDGLTLFEVACLLHRLDPRAVSDDAHHGIRRRGGTAAEVLKNPAATAEMLHLNPAAFFVPPVGDTLERLKRAAGSRLGLSVNAARARELAAMLGLPYPPELEREAQAPAAVVNSSRTPAGSANAELFALARAEALKVIARYAARDLYPPQISIADEVAADLRKRGVFGADGKPLTGATIKRHALRGISSATRKAQSTTLKRGK